MRTLTFAPFEIDSNNAPVDAEAPEPQAWLLLWDALLDYVPGNDEKVAVKLELLIEEFKGLSIKDVENEARTLDPKGAGVAMEDAKFDVLVSAWRAKRAELPGRFIKQRNFVTRMLDDAPSYNEKEWAEKLKGDATAPLDGTDK
jgi:hypothetical protein